MVTTMVDLICRGQAPNYQAFSLTHSPQSDMAQGSENLTPNKGRRGRLYQDPMNQQLLSLIIRYHKVGVTGVPLLVAC